MHDLAMRLTQTCLSMGLIDESYAEWLTYSIEKRLTTLLTLFVLCLIGFFGFGWKLTLSFSVFFLLIRKYTNGYHAATYNKCLFLSLLMEVFILAVISNQGKLLSSAEGEHWLVHTANRYHFAYMSTANELLKQLMTIHAYDLIHQYAALALTIAPENTKAYYWLIQSYLKQNMEEMATGELVAARQKLPDEEYQKLLQELKK